MVEFLVFNSAFGRWIILINTLSNQHQCFQNTLPASSWATAYRIIMAASSRASASRVMLPMHPESNDGDIIRYASTEARVEHEKLNQTAP